ncbi:hypothetical protein FV194_33605 [Pseudomonas aeruginosa]|nr:hypothetical protein [Pseudomonas aeruginosa]
MSVRIAVADGDRHGAFDPAIPDRVPAAVGVAGPGEARAGTAAPMAANSPTVVSLTYKGFDIGYVVTDMPLVSAAKDIAVTTPVQAP